MITRQEVGEEELLNILNSELARHAVLSKCRFVSLKRSKPDGSGCNWSAVIKSGGVPHHVSAPITGKIMTEARRKYNLK